jgi:hypothetical protein
VWAEGTFLRQHEKVPPAHAQQVCPSVCPLVWNTKKHRLLSSPQHWSVLRAVYTLNIPQDYIRLLGGVVAHPFDALAWSARPHVGR